ncbi:hypothetical protein BDQ12DRAFT_681418 [Crucibulum laeve]|uniref:Uncharacterized protein n=1 Tax=Crucibulum laeve TaxID=68775 RepID=A0A5C3M387_9AGAR|nr:hypothetical protein BDQ12DRAFT_681418 [Crucibulum laeve]
MTSPDITSHPRLVLCNPVSHPHRSTHSTLSHPSYIHTPPPSLALPVLVCRSSPDLHP